MLDRKSALIAQWISSECAPQAPLQNMNNCLHGAGGPNLVTVYSAPGPAKPSEWQNGLTGGRAETPIVVIYEPCGRQPRVFAEVPAVLAVRDCNCQRSSSEFHPPKLSNQKKTFRTSQFLPLVDVRTRHWLVAISDRPSFSDTGRVLVW